MKISLRLSGAVIYISFLFCVSCSKRDHYEVDCKIEKITEYRRLAAGQPYQITTATFSYNAWGDPTTIILNQVSPGNPHFYFYYDHKRRLTSLIARHSADSVVYYTRYAYNNQQFIERDTTYYYGSDINNPASFYMWAITKYTYDSKGRVTKTETLYSIDQTQTWYTITYPYDANGNKIRPGVPYDNKTNFLRTNLIFMFINRDYSKNNPYVADSYNAKGLPTYRSPERRPGQLTFMNLGAHKIEYSCDRHYSKFD